MAVSFVASLVVACLCMLRDTMINLRARQFCGFLVVSLFLFPAAASAQMVRTSGSTTLRFVELRSLVRDSVSADSTQGSALLRQLPDGRIVRCIPGESFCRDTRPGPTLSSIPVIHDFDISAWGFGRGLRLFSQFRVRQTLGGESGLWPREDDPFDVLTLYGEMERESLRIRAGRQSITTGLGFYNFDGIALALRASQVTSVEAYVGRSLVRGLNETRTGEAIAAVEELPAPTPGTLVGIHARYRPSPRVAIGATYQADFRLDGRGVYSELVAANGALEIGRFNVDASVEVDAASALLNEARLHVESKPLGNIAPFVEVRRYRPYFELWTIWGAFSPLGFDEARGGATLSAARGSLLVRAEALYRDYGNDDADETLDSFRTRGWGFGGNVVWSASPAWTATAAYRIESGFGASGWNSQLGARRALGDRGSVGLSALFFAQLYEFRLSDGTVVGLSGDASYRLGDRLQLYGAASLYRHKQGDVSTSLDWNQRRATLRLAWTVGAEPGMSVVPGVAR